MAAFSRLDVLNTVIKTGLVPVFYHPDVEVTKKVAQACAAGGCPVVEFTNRETLLPRCSRSCRATCERRRPASSWASAP